MRYVLGQGDDVMVESTESCLVSYARAQGHHPGPVEVDAAAPRVRAREQTRPAPTPRTSLRRRTTPRSPCRVEPVAVAGEHRRWLVGDRRGWWRTRRAHEVGTRLGSGTPRVGSRDEATRVRRSWARVLQTHGGEPGQPAASQPPRQMHEVLLLPSSCADARARATIARGVAAAAVAAWAARPWGTNTTARAFTFPWQRRKG